jgi:hypothetical protein
MATRGKEGTDLSIEDATVALINSDPDLRAALRELILDATARYKHVIRWGAPDARLAAIKAIVPGLLRAMGKVEQGEEEAKMRAAYDRIMQAEGRIFGHAPGENPRDGDDELDLPPDLPPAAATPTT